MEKVPIKKKIGKGDVLAWTIGKNTSYYTYDPGNADAVGGFVGAGIDQGTMEPVVVTGKAKSGSGISANGFWVLWGAREYYSYKAGSLKGRFGKDYAGGSAARTELKTVFRNSATPYPIKTFLDRKYPIVNKYNPVTKPTPSYWHVNGNITWAMRGLGVASVAWDASGLYNYYNNPGAINSVSPGNFAMNMGTTGAMTFGGAFGFGAGTYFTLGRVVYSSYENFKDMPLERQWNFVNTQMHSGTAGLSSFIK